MNELDMSKGAFWPSDFFFLYKKAQIILFFIMNETNEALRKYLGKTSLQGAYVHPWRWWGDEEILEVIPKQIQYILCLT